MVYKELCCDDPRMSFTENLSYSGRDYNGVFIGKCDWVEILIPCDFFGNVYANIFDELVVVVGELISGGLFVKTLFSVESLWPRCFEVTASIEAFEELYMHEGFSLADYVVFDRSGDWGVYSDGCAGYTVVGGKRYIVDRLANRLGGVGKLRDDSFERLVKNKILSEESVSALLEVTRWPDVRGNR